jgi:hypothetical protein
MDPFLTLPHSLRPVGSTRRFGVSNSITTDGESSFAIDGPNSQTTNCDEDIDAALVRYSKEGVFAPPPPLPETT